MPSIQDDRLHAHAQKVKGKVVVITGAANGIGRETALQFAKYGAKVVIGDRDVVGAEQTVQDIVRNGGDAAFRHCDVCAWDDQIDLFILAMSKFGAVDIVIPNAGVGESGVYDTVRFNKAKPLPPNLTTHNVNMIGLLYTVHLALHYLRLDRTELSLKSLVLIGSISSWNIIPNAHLYTASKHAILGIMRSLYSELHGEGIRVASIHPFFADTAIVPFHAKIFLAGIPKTTVERIAGAIFYAATDPDMETSGSAWLLADDGPVLQIERGQFKPGVYDLIDSTLRTVGGVPFYFDLAKELNSLFGKPLLVLSLGVAVVMHIYQISALDNIKLIDP